METPPRPLSDTHPKIHKMMVEGYRKMSAAEKFRRIEGMLQFMETLLRAEVRERYPEADEREIQLRVASRRVPPELLKKAFGWDVKKEGY